MNKLEDKRGGLKMLYFRNMALEDIEYIYNHQLLKPLVTVPPIGEKFGVVIDDGGRIIGGATGYTDKDKAVIQKIVVDNVAELKMLKESLIRSVIHVLDRRGVKTIFIDKSEEELCKKIGFQEFTGEKQDSLLFIDTEKFFQRPCCSTSIETKEK